MQRLLVIAALAACHAQPAPGRSAEVATVPFEDDFGLIFVEVAVGDAAPRWFILDSGADQTILDRAVATELGLALDGDGGSEAQPGGEIAIAHARDVTFRAGAAAFTAPDVIVTPLAPLFRYVGRPFAGLLGHAFLERYTTRVSYDQRRLTFYEPSRFDYRGGGESIPVEIVAAEPWVHATLDGGGARSDARLKLDTGSLEALGLSGGFVAQSGLFAEAARRMPRPGVGIGGGTQSVVVQLPAMQLGSHRFGPMIVNYSAKVDPDDRSILGAQILQRFTVTFDYARKRLILERGARYAEPFPVEGSGLFGATFPDDLRRFTVLAVAPGTPADEAGLAAGDEVTSVDGTPFASYGLARFYARLRDLRPVSLAVRRGDAERTVALALRPLP